MDQIVTLLRGDFSVIPSMKLEMQHIQQKILSLTEEQFSALDSTKLNKHVIIQGGAGTGKSLLALEKFRQVLAQDKNVLYLCFNRNMAKYTYSSLVDSNYTSSQVMTYHSLINSLLQIEEIFNKNISEISKYLLDDKTLILPQYNYIIIDEAQDLINPDVIEVLDKLLKNGFNNGSWVMFLDPNQNIFNKNEDYNFIIDYINETYHPSYYPLNHNCRNTEQIARETTVVSNVPHAKYLKITGPIVKKYVYSNNDELKNLVRKELLSLFSGGTMPSDITILSKYKYVNSGIRDLKSLHNYTIFENPDIEKYFSNTINYFTIQSFKGLESNIVFLIDVDGFESDQNRMLNYIAMSRAKILLYIFYHASAKEEYNVITSEGIELL